jgi:hypothetical protein
VLVSRCGGWHLSNIIQGTPVDRPTCILAGMQKPRMISCLEYDVDSMSLEP